ncbi:MULTISPECIES: ribose-5-phosphate isomerase RpiA [unclassified Haladaptatus]|uniref:ribose-5-phosphate isomerase RpiA n=1 Tax=unclassified Haladaptatus TaxID=2622732 RepID=UPI0023E799C2|nr:MULTISPECIES: ribose-5-phosphate isomerase RpiA [unclassified Haladaptatus]
MKTTGGSDDAKRRAGERAAEEATDGMVVGLGTGSTTAHAIRALGRAVDSGLDICGIPTSFQSRQLAIEAGIPLTALDEVETVHLAIDGTDQFAGRHLIKGGGAAHTREKLVDSAAERFVVVADPSKQAEVLDHPVPVEVLPDAWTVVTEEIAAKVGGEATLREAERKDGPVVTDNGNLVLDCDFDEVRDPAMLALDLAAIPGVVEHGLFINLVDTVYVGTDDGVEEHQF